jgi:hypothetical protein
MKWFNITCDGMPWPIDWNNLYLNWSWTYSQDNARLANVTAALLYIPPKWVGNTIAAAWWIVILAMMGRMAHLNQRRWDLMAILAMLLMTVPSWFDAIVVADFQLNYTWGTAFTVISLWLFLREKDINPFFAFALGGCMGTWNEGFSIPLLLALITLTILHPRFRTKGRITFIIAIGIGVFLLARAGGFKHKILGQISPISSISLQCDAFCSLATIAFFAMSILAVKVCGKAQLLCDALWQSLVVISLASIAIKCAAGDNYHAGWAAQVFSCWGMVYVLSLCVKRHITIKMKIIGAASAALLAAHMITADIMTSIVGHEINTFVAETIKKPRGTKFLPKTTLEKSPLLALGKPTYFTFCWMHHYEFYHMSMENRLYTKYIPEELADYDGNGGTLLPSGEIVKYKGAYIAPAHGLLGCERKYYVTAKTTSSVLSHDIDFLCSPFYSPADGHTYLLLEPSFLEPHNRNIIDIKPDWTTLREES